MSTKPVSLDRLRIATPCPVGWEQMTGHNRVRFCELCKLNVYNISELTRTEVESLIASSEGRLCAKLYRRADGTVLTKDCPVGLRAVRLRVSKRVAAMFAAIAGITSIGLGQQSSSKDQKNSCAPQTRITRRNAAPNILAVLSGTVRDHADGVIAGAKVTLKLADTDVTWTTSTNEEGYFEFNTLAPANYSIKVESLGFQTLQVLNLVFEKDKLTNIDIMLEVGSVGELVGIVPKSSLIDSTPGTTIITEQMIRRFPIP